MTFTAAVGTGLDEEAWSEAVASAGGVIVQTGSGAAKVAVFTRPSDAVAVALATSSEVGLRRRGWTNRTAVHMAAADPVGRGYPPAVLLPLLRLCEAGQPGDVLLSNPAAELARDDLPGASALVDLGALRLPGLPRRMRVWRLVHDDLPEEPAPLRTVDALLHGVLGETTSFVGRHAELAEVVGSLEAHQLVSVVGVGGVDKTRLAMSASVEAAARGTFPDGVHVVDLGALDRPEQVMLTVAKSLGLSDQAGRTVEASILEHLSDARALVVLDNCEHVLDAAAGVVALVQPASRLRVLATSRHPLGVAGERAVELAPLAAADAVVLFADRAIAAFPPFDPTRWEEAIAAICRQLDGIPLAVELVAARADLAPPPTVLDRLQAYGSLDVSAPRAQARHGSLRTAMAWSFGLLERPEATLLLRLAVFRGGFDVPAADAVCGYPPLEGVDRFGLLAALVDHSLVRAGEESGRARYRLLEPVRQLALDRLAEIEGTEAAATRHFEWCRGLAAEATAMAAVAGICWLERLQTEHDNLLAALRWEGARAEDRLALAVALGQYWHTRGLWWEGRRELLWSLARAGEASTSLRARAGMRLGVLEMRLGHTGKAEALLADAAEVLGRLGETRGHCEALGWRAMLQSRLGDNASARAHGRRAVSVATESGDQRARGQALDLLAQVEHQAGDFDCLLSLQNEALKAFRAASDRPGEAHALHGVGRALLGLGDLDGARRRIADAHRLFVELGEPFGRAVTALGLGRVEINAHRNREALTALAESLDGMAGLDDPRGIAHSLQGIALAALELGETEDPIRLLGAGSLLFDDIGVVPNGHEKQECERALGRARRELGAPLTEELWGAGRATPRTTAVALGRRLAADLTRPPAHAHPVRQQRMFRSEGEQVRVEFDAGCFFVARAKGTDYLARLLAQPAQELHVLDLIGQPLHGTSGWSGLGPVLDAEAKSAYKRRLDELREDMDEADRFADSERSARARLEIDALTRELSAAVGLFGRDRAVGTAAERARQSVTKAIRAAQVRIATQSPALGRHLAVTVRTGTFCAYLPDPSVPWET